MSGSEAEPSPHRAAEQMRAATDRLRDKAWMVAPLTSPELTPPPGDHAEAASAGEG